MDAEEVRRIRQATERLHSELAFLFDRNHVLGCTVRISPYYDAEGRLRVILDVSAEQMDFMRQKIRE